MNLTSLLQHLDCHNIDIWVENGELLVGMEQHTSLPDDIHEYIQVNKKVIMKRLLNNSFARSRNWIVGNYGEVYSYQYSLTGYVFIERNKDETVDVYRCKFDTNLHVTNIKGLHRNIRFSTAYQKSKSFLKWFYGVNNHLKN
ncbi:hypothetical protein GLV94_18515 [Virgibacillus halodenitrificans]|uniref:hypothetical protein n=1 Tax=Virgibacillus halodenitrificans TaxID=1482 RepID=UPI00136A7615|nr:hypothetical protein [Virgibacillus halodenitrificans]MYL47637.1 hypothetical protein [Virgibacillus halodenitrificans]